MGGSAAHSNSSKLERLLLRMSRKDDAAFEALYAATKQNLLSTTLPVVNARIWRMIRRALLAARAQIGATLPSPALLIPTVGRPCVAHAKSKDHR